MPCLVHMTKVTKGHDGDAATNMLAISFSRRDKAQASSILSDAIAIAAVLGCCLAVAMYFYAPPALRAINGQASAELVEPAVTYVRWRYAEPSGGHTKRNLHYCVYNGYLPSPAWQWSRCNGRCVLLSNIAGSTMLARRALASAGALTGVWLAAAGAWACLQHC